MPFRSRCGPRIFGVGASAVLNGQGPTAWHMRPPCLGTTESPNTFGRDPLPRPNVVGAVTVRERRRMPPKAGGALVGPKEQRPPHLSGKGIGGPKAAKALPWCGGGPGGPKAAEAPAQDVSFKAVDPPPPPPSAARAPVVANPHRSQAFVPNQRGLSGPKSTEARAPKQQGPRWSRSGGGPGPNGADVLAVPKPRTPVHLGARVLNGPKAGEASSANP